MKKSKDGSHLICRMLVGALFSGDFQLPYQLSWPLGAVEIRTDGVSVDFSHWLLRPLIVVGIFGMFRIPLWSSSWEALSESRLTKRGVVLVNDSGRRCVIMHFTQSNLERLWNLVEARGIEGSP